jgi:hypothetical protein
MNADEKRRSRVSGKKQNVENESAAGATGRLCRATGTFLAHQRSDPCRSTAWSARRKMRGAAKESIRIPPGAGQGATLGPTDRSGLNFMRRSKKPTMRPNRGRQQIRLQHPMNTV